MIIFLRLLCFLKNTSDGAISAVFLFSQKGACLADYSADVVRETRRPFFLKCDCLLVIRKFCFLIVKIDCHYYVFIVSLSRFCVPYTLNNAMTVVQS